MQYIDTGQRNPSQALGTWLQGVMLDDVVEARWQSGFFGADSLGILQSTLKRMATEKKTVHALIGSNDQTTIIRDVERLVGILGIPRDRALLGVVSYANGYYHPKTFHVRRTDGSQAAYVGSANLTGSGVASLNIEAGVTLDSRDGDPSAILDDVASAVDIWFKLELPGLHQILSMADVERLLAEEILAETAPPRPPVTKPKEGDKTPTPRDRLKPLMFLPPLEEPTTQVADVVLEATQLRSIILPTAPRQGFPQYLLFAPGQGTPTQGSLALSGALLPSNAVGLVIRLNKDSSRHFEGRPGTANISIPVPTLTTFRFGLFPGRYPRPRVEFSLRIRFLTSDTAISVEPIETGIMAYGFIPGETGHGDVRMVLPAIVKTLAQRIQSSGRQLPRPGDVALLEWPTSNERHEFRLSFLERQSPLFQQAEELFKQAQDSDSTVGDGACWLPTALSPKW